VDHEAVVTREAGHDSNTATQRQTDDQEQRATSHSAMEQMIGTPDRCDLLGMD
jgi:hypothetical protein